MAADSVVFYDVACAVVKWLKRLTLSEGII
jgi:hypothetical protein